MPVDRDALRDTAKYLRNVRPLDPEEISNYLEDQPDPRAVRIALREEAADLGLVEREDGAFVPVEDDPVRVRFGGVEALPNEYAFALEGLLIERYGRDWHDGESGVRLRETIRKLKEDYYRRNPVEYDEEVALAYAVYHLPDYYATIQYVLDDLARDGLLTRDLRVLDVGAGVGGPALGLHDYLEASAEPVLVDYDAVEPSAAAAVLEELLAETGSNFHPDVVRETAEAFEVDREYDLVCFNNVLSELDEPVDVVERYLDALADDGTFVATAPADKHTSTHLREVERTVEDHGAATVYGPTVRLWEGERPSDRGWSFDERPDIATPGFQERLARGADDPSAFTNTSVKFSYSFLRTDGERRYDVSLSTARYAKMAEMGHHVPDRIDLVAAKLSRNLAERAGANPLFKVSDGSEDVEHYAVLVKENALNRDLLEAEYGDLLVFEQALALWNDDEEAYNLVCDEETVVDVYAR